MPLTLLFCHGWGFDASVWDPLCELLDDYPQARDDAGYFDAAAAPEVPGPVLAISHSFGTMRLLADPPPGLAGLVALAGFERFTVASDFPGAPFRVVDRMVSAVAQEPETVLADFHARLGSTPPTGTPDAARLQADLVVMRDADLRPQAAELGVPILSLQGERDPILGVAMRETVFAGVPGVMRRTHPSAGHVLPREDPLWCAQAIRSFADGLA